MTLLDPKTFLELDHVVSGFYDAAVGDVSWTEPLKRCGSVLNTSMAVFSLRDPITRKAHFSFGNIGAADEYLKLFANKLSTLSPFVTSTAMGAVGEVINPIDLIGRAEYEQGRFHQEWSKPQGIVDYIGAVLERQPQAIYTLAFGRRAPAPLFDERDRAILDFVVPHAIRALHISGRLKTLEAEKRELLTSIDALAAPIISVGRNGKVLLMNAAAGEAMAKLGLFAINDGRLRFQEASVESCLERATVSHGSEAFSIESRSKAGLRIHMLPLKDKRENRVLIVLDQTRSSSPGWGSHVAQKYGLTVAELRVFMRLLDGRTPTEIADDHGVSINTVRTQFAGLFSKTNTNKQSELVRLVLKELPSGMPVFKTPEIERLLQAAE